MKRELITDIAGQDGSYLAELLISKGYEVHGIVRRFAIEDAEHKLKNIGHFLDKISLCAAPLDNVLSTINFLKTLCWMNVTISLRLASSLNSFDEEIPILNNIFSSTR